MQLIKLQIFLIIGPILLLGCSTKSITGHFSDSKNTISFAGAELWLSAAGTFRLNEWSDNYIIQIDDNGEIVCPDEKGKGIGRFEIIQDSINLFFENNDFITCHLEILESSDNIGQGSNYELNIKMLDELSEPFEAATISLIDEQEKVILAGITDSDGNLQLVTKEISKPVEVQISAFGMKSLVLDISTNLGKSVHELKRCFGYYARNDTAKYWFKSFRNRIQYKRKNGRLRQLKRVRIKNN